MSKIICGLFEARQGISAQAHLPMKRTKSFNNPFKSGLRRPHSNNDFHLVDGDPTSPLTPASEMMTEEQI